MKEENRIRELQGVIAKWIRQQTATLSSGVQIPLTPLGACTWVRQGLENYHFARVVT